jgi:hypothetical protein
MRLGEIAVDDFEAYCQNEQNDYLHENDLIENEIESPYLQPSLFLNEN